MGEIMKTTQPNRLNRRQLLGTLGAAGLAIGTPRALRAADKTDVIVLGAGLSGLYSAMLLKEQGLKVRVLEASDHAGGRVQTRNIGGQLHELGASDIGVMYARVLNMMTELGLERVPSSIKVRPYSYHIGGELLRAEQWESADVNQTVGEERSIEPGRLEGTLLNRLNPLQELDDWLLPEYRPFDVPIATFLSDQGVSDAAIRIIGQSYNGNGMGRTSALAMFRDTNRIGFGIQSFMSMKKAGMDVSPLSQVKGGNQRLPDAMAAQLGDIMHYGRIATRVEQDQTGVEVTTLDGPRYRAAFLIISIPLLSLRNISFTPALSPEKSAAVSTIDYYPVTKFYLRPTAPFWEADEFEPSMWTDGPIERVFAGTDANDEVQTLLVWINGQGSRRIDQFGQEAATRFVLDQLGKIRPASRGKVEVTGYQSWGRDPFIGGCGHSYSAGQVTRFAESLPLPEGRIHFAGEHTRRTEMGMESAMASAERVVGELLEIA